MRIAFGSDAAASSLKLALMEHARALGHTCLDVGAHDGEPNDYPIYAVRAGQAVLEHRCDTAVAICGTGIGMSMAANRLPGIRCALCADCYSAKMTRAHNDANMLALGARVIGVELAKMILEFFLDTPFEGGRHVRRVEMIAKAQRAEPLE